MGKPQDGLEGSAYIGTGSFWKKIRRVRDTLIVISSIMGGYLVPKTQLMGLLEFIRKVDFLMSKFWVKRR